MADLRDVIIGTERMLLAPISFRYQFDIFRAFTERVARYTWPQPTGNIADIDAFISEGLEGMRNGVELQFVAISGESGGFIGCVGLHHLLVRPEPGLWLKESVWGMGFGFEAVSGLKRWADKHLEYEYLYYPVHKENVASRRIPEKLGGKLDPDEFVTKNARGVECPMVSYRIFRT